MTSTLFVLCNSDNVGKLTIDERRRWVFQYDPVWLKNQNPFPLSIRLPLQEAPFEDDFAKPFFSNLLPEGKVRQLIAAKQGQSATNDFEMLAVLGGECAGAISTYPAEQPPPKNGNYRELSESELDDLISEMPRRPLLLADGKARLSLAGVQDKLPVFYEDKKLFLPEDGAPSSHILKPSMPNFEDTVFNEAFCMKLARSIGLEVPDIEIIFCKKKPIYLVKRYDREGASRSNLKRLHQEDFCQALGRYPDQKYQSEGGPSFSDCFRVVEEFSQRPAVDKKGLISWAVFNFLIGNCDAHAKNISLLISSEGVHLAPFYDLMSTSVYEGLSEKLAMKIGEKYKRRDIFERHWETFAQEAGVGTRFVLKIVNEFSKELPSIAKSEAEFFTEHFGGEKTLTKIVTEIENTAKRFFET
ncbi:MAG: type II toxin-antitoxin system HipA family toxin [bacterium]